VISKFIETEKVINYDSCPFIISLNQLWRNILLSEKVKDSRGLDECHFYIIYPKENIDLLNDHKSIVETSIRKILTSQGNKCFKVIHLEHVGNIIRTIIIQERLSEIEHEWINKFIERYTGN
jgi:hypothetical protein